MSLMLNALRRIEAKQRPVPAREAVAPVEAIELPPAISADVLPSIPLGDCPPLEQVSLEEALDQLQALLVAEAGSLDDAEAEADANESRDADLPVVAPVASDPYAAMAHQILRQLPRGRSQVLLFTSPADGQGKTMTVARLAPRLAQGMEGEVLVVDANSRNPAGTMSGTMYPWSWSACCLAEVPVWRLPDVLAGAANWAAAVQTTGHERVSLLPGGSDPLGRSPGRNVQGMSHLLRELAGHYAMVVVDAASLAHRGTVQLAAVCDGTYLVVRLGEGSPRMLREAVQVVQGNGGRLLGCVAVDA